MQFSCWPTESFRSHLSESIMYRLHLRSSLLLLSRRIQLKKLKVSNSVVLRSSSTRQTLAREHADARKILNSRVLGVNRPLNPKTEFQNTEFGNLADAYLEEGKPLDSGRYCRLQDNFTHPDNKGRQLHISIRWGLITRLRKAGEHGFAITQRVATPHVAVR